MFSVSRPNPPLVRRTVRAPHCALALLATVLVMASGGCVNISAMFTKMMFGDPQIDASFKQRTGVKLDDKHPVIVYCTAPVTLMDHYSSVAFDLQKQLSRRMERRGIKVVDPGSVCRAVDDQGGHADATALVRLFPEAEYVVFVSLGGFDCVEPNSPELLRGYAGGMIRGYAARGEDSSARQAIQIFEQEFQVEHPTHAVPRDSISLSTFEKQFLDHLSDELGRVFYDFRTSEIF